MCSGFETSQHEYLEGKAVYDLVRDYQSVGPLGVPLCETIMLDNDLLDGVDGNVK
jgi:hypothetical protein